MVPNYTGDSISSTLLSIPLLYVALISLVSQTKEPVQKRSRWIQFGLGVPLFLGVVWMQQDSWLLVMGIVLSLILLFLVRKINANWILSIKGAFIFLFSYLSLSGFGIEQLLQLKILLFIFVAITYFTAFYSKSNIKWSFILFLSAILAVTFIQGTVSFYWPILLVFIPQLLGNILNKKGIWIEITTVLGLSGYFIYYVLYATYLIQALQGGY